MNSAAASLYPPPEGYSFTFPFPIRYPIAYPIIYPTTYPILTPVLANANTVGPPVAIDARFHERLATPPGERAAKRQKRQQPVVCEFCHRSMRNDSLDRHQSNCRSNPDQASRIPCPKCPKTFSRQDGLRRHLKTACPGTWERAFTVAGASSEIPEPSHSLFSATSMSYTGGQPVALPATFISDSPVPIATQPQFEPTPGPSQPPYPIESAIRPIPETDHARIFDTDFMWVNLQQDPVYPSSSGPTFDPSTENHDGAYVDVPRYALPSEFQPNSLPGVIDEKSGLTGWPDFLDPVLELDELLQT